MIRAKLAVPNGLRPKATYVLDVLSQRWGLPVRVTADAHLADLVYGDAKTTRPGAVAIPCHARLYDRQGPMAPAGRAGWEEVPADGTFDLVGSTYRLLTLLDEARVPDAHRDDKGTFSVSSLPCARRAAADVALVEVHAGSLLRALETTRPRLRASALPRWPQGKRYAVVLTHDVDAVHIGAPMELLTNLAKAVTRRRLAAVQMVLSGLLHLGRPARNPLQAFGRWAAWERARGLRSAFYLFLRPNTVRRHLNDCKSDVRRHGADWEAISAMSAEGWEFAVHAPIHAKTSSDALAYAKRWVEERLEAPVFGLRHHYWALDWHRPHLTFRRHADAGFSYDTSIAWRDAAGFRAGTCLPYAPFDPERDEAVPMLELPTCLMDGHILPHPLEPVRPQRSEAISTGRRILETVRRHGGVGILDWHQETACGRFGYGLHVDVLDEVLVPVLAGGEAWLATPQEVCRHWSRRARTLRED